MARQKAPLRAIMAARLAAMMVASLVVLGLLGGRTAHASTTFTVNSNGDEGEPAASQGDGRCDWDASTTGRECTLRSAIQEANATSNSGGPDEIIFVIGGSGAQKTISPSSPLPPITAPITIDGYTQSGASPNTLAAGNDAVLNIRLDGEAIEQGSVVAGLDIETSDSTIKGLVIRRFDYSYGTFIIRGAQWSTRESPTLAVGLRCANCATTDSVSLSLVEARRCGFEEPASS